MSKKLAYLEESLRFINEELDALNIEIFHQAEEIYKKHIEFEFRVKIAELISDGNYDEAIFILQEYKKTELFAERPKPFFLLALYESPEDEFSQFSILSKIIVSGRLDLLKLIVELGMDLRATDYTNTLLDVAIKAKEEASEDNKENIKEIIYFLSSQNIGLTSTILDIVENSSIIEESSITIHMIEMRKSLETKLQDTIYDIDKDAEKLYLEALISSIKIHSRFEGHISKIHEEMRNPKNIEADIENAVEKAKATIIILQERGVEFATKIEGELEKLITELRDLYPTPTPEPFSPSTESVISTAEIMAEVALLTKEAEELEDEAKYIELHKIKPLLCIVDEISDINRASDITRETPIVAAIKYGSIFMVDNLLHHGAILPEMIDGQIISDYVTLHFPAWKANQLLPLLGIEAEAKLSDKLPDHSTEAIAEEKADGGSIVNTGQAILTPLCHRSHGINSCGKLISPDLITSTPGLVESALVQGEEDLGTPMLGSSTDAM